MTPEDVKDQESWDEIDARDDPDPHGRLVALRDEAINEIRERCCGKSRIARAKASIGSPTMVAVDTPHKMNLNSADTDWWKLKSRRG